MIDVAFDDVWFPFHELDQSRVDSSAIKSLSAKPDKTNEIVDLLSVDETCSVKTGVARPIVYQFNSVVARWRGRGESAGGLKLLRLFRTRP